MRGAAWIVVLVMLAGARSATADEVPVTWSASQEEKRAADLLDLIWPNPASWTRFNDLPIAFDTAASQDEAWRLLQKMELPERNFHATNVLMGFVDRSGRGSYRQTVAILAYVAQCRFRPDGTFAISDFNGTNRNIQCAGSDRDPSDACYSAARMYGQRPLKAF